MEKRFRKSGLRVRAAAMAIMLGAGCALGSGLSGYGPSVVMAEENEQEAKSVNVIGEATVWNYLDDNTDPAEGLASLSAWTEKGFDDSAWKQSAGKFGAKKGELTTFNGFTPTVLLQQYITGTTTDIPTFFFRTTFVIDNLDEVTSISGSLYHDDAVAVYLNGHKITSVDMPTEAQNSNLYYAGVSAGAPKQADIKLTEEQVKEYAVEGENVLAVELHNDRADSSDIYLEFSNLALNYNEKSESEEPISKVTTQKSVILTMGSDETSRNLTWYADTKESAEVQYAPKASMVNGEFPDTYATASAATSASNDAEFYTNQATLENLTENTEYVYRLKNGEQISDIYSFSTGDFDGAFSFALVGDPQIGAGSTQADIEGWNLTLDTITSKLQPDFMISAGDQVNTASSETEYSGYLNEVLSSLASATTIGNHDSSSAAYGEHFNLPNESAEYGITNAGGDYWFVYNNTLFMDINSNDLSTAEHKAFLEEAIAANPDVTWKTVIFHHSIYSTASHVNDSDIIARRAELPQVFADLDIDVVLMGHDHVYTRTYMMNEYTPDSENGPQESVTNPTGILYLTANSASGSKYYDVKAADAEYVAKQDQSYRRTVTDIQVSDTAYSMTTYYADDMSVLDSFTIYKTDKNALENEIANAEEILENEADYTEDSWNSFKDAYDAANEVLADENAAQETIDQSCADLQAAIAGLQKAEDSEGSQDDNKNDNQNDNQSGVQDNTQKGSQDDSQNSSNDGKKTDTKKSETPKTGDTSNAAAAGLLMVGAGSVVVMINRRRKHA